MKLGQVGVPYVLISVLGVSVIATKSTSISSKAKRKVLNLHRVFAIFLILLNDLSDEMRLGKCTETDVNIEKGVLPSFPEISLTLSGLGKL